MESMFILYSVFDTMAKKFGPVFEAVNDEVAARQYSLMLDKVDKRFKKDYVLYRIGNFDFVSGMLEGQSGPIEVNISIKE